MKLCGFLRDEGVEASVLTVDPSAYTLPGEYPPDPTLAADVPSGLRVTRTPTGGRRRVRDALSRLGLFRFAHHLAPGAFFERQAAWLGPLTAALLDEIDRTRPDVLLTSSQPYVVHLAGLAAQQATGIAWVADFRDPWTLSWGRSWPSERAFRWEDRREEEVLASADRVLANTPGTRREWLERRPWLDGRKILVARNGYDPEDFRGAAPRSDGTFRIVHAGSFRVKPPGDARRGVRAALDRRGPEPVPYDVRTHSPEALLVALAALGPAAARVRVRCVGAVDPGWAAFADSIGVGPNLETTGYRPHRETTAEMLAADLLWLPTITRRDGRPVSNVPAKTYEYLGSGRPVLALAGPGDVEDVLGDRERCLRVRPGPGAEEAMADTLRDVVERGPPAGTEPDPPDAHPYRRSETARAVAAALRDAAASAAAPRSLDPAAAGAETPVQP